MKEALKPDTGRNDSILEYIGMLDHVKFHAWLLQDSQTCRKVNRAHANFFGRKKEELASRKPTCNIYEIFFVKIRSFI
jgi:hypothetical protein